MAHSSNPESHEAAREHAGRSSAGRRAKQAFVMPASRFAKAQRRHFALTVLLPSLAVVSGPLYLPDGWIGWRWVMLALAMWWLTGCLGISVGYHRLFAHRSFSSLDGVRFFLGVLGSMAGQGSVTYWTALHRMHHARADSVGDPHSPAPQANPGRSAAAALLRSHMGWVLSHDVPSPARYAADLQADPVAIALGRCYLPVYLSGYLLPAAIGWWMDGTAQGALMGAWWGGALRVVVGQHVIWSINSICHCIGARPHPTNDRSTNAAALALISWGESWHNNHHADASNPRLGRSWREPDIGFWCIAGLQFAGLAQGRRRGGDGRH